jgi:hypothetical protein
MERDELRALLAAGPSRRFNVLEVTVRQERAGEPLLFRHRFLNRCIILKHLDHRDRGRGSPATDLHHRPANTLIYLPYDPERPFEGGESMFYAQGAFRALLAARTTTADRPSADVLHDEAILDVLDDLPALNPFLLREALARAGQRVPDAYVAPDAEIAERLQRRLHRRVRPLVVAALDHDDAAADCALATLVDAFLQPERSDHLKLLGAALRLDPEQAPQLLSAWAGIAFFEEELARLKPTIHDFAHWLTRPWTALPAGGDGELSHVRRRVRAAWAEIRDIADTYQNSYRALVFHSDPEPFVDFLRRCSDSYRSMGDLLGRFEQAVHAWRLHTKTFARKAPPPEVMAEFLGFLRRTFDAGDAADGGLAAAAG